VAGWAALAVAVVAVGCGYHALSAARGPAGGRAIAVGAVDVAAAGDAPLASALAEALPVELARAGVPLAAAGSAGAATLLVLLEPVSEEAEAYPRAPEALEVPSATGRLPGVWALRVRLRVRLEDPDGAMLWDGTVTARAAYAESASLAERAASRARAERDLAAALAARVREVLVR
jgi:hypothetical protein